MGRSRPVNNLRRTSVSSTGATGPLSLAHADVMPQCKLHDDAAPSLLIPERRLARAVDAADATAATAEASPAAAAAPKPLSATPEEHRERAQAWERRLKKFDRQDRGMLKHREGLDRRATTLRMRIEGLAQELRELGEEYATLQLGDDRDDRERWQEHEALCVDAEAHGEPAPRAPCSIAGYHDTSTPLRDADGKLKQRLFQQRGDRAPDWLPTLTSVLHTASTAWQELSRGAASPAAEDTPFRRAVDAIKEVGTAVRQQWKPQYNLCSHGDGTAESVAENVIEGGVAFNFNDRFGESWRVHLARHDASEDARAPLTGTRTNGALSFECDAPLPLDYCDQNREHELADVGRTLGPRLVAAEVTARGHKYEDMIRTRWIRERPNQPLSAERCAVMVEQRARLELAKAKATPKPTSHGPSELAASTAVRMKKLAADRAKGQATTPLPPELNTQCAQQKAPCPEGGRGV